MMRYVAHVIGNDELFDVAFLIIIMLLASFVSAALQINQDIRPFIVLFIVLLFVYAQRRFLPRKESTEEYELSTAGITISNKGGKMIIPYGDIEEVRFRASGFFAGMPSYCALTVYHKNGVRVLSFWKSDEREAKEFHDEIKSNIGSKAKDLRYKMNYLEVAKAFGLLILIYTMALLLTYIISKFIH